MATCAARTARQSSPRSGLTLLELTVAIGIVVVLMALLIPAVQQARSAAHRVTCQNNLRQFGVALDSYVGVHAQYPTATRSTDYLYWRLLPYFGEAGLLETLRQWQTADGEFPASLYLPSFGCPSDPVVWENMLIGDTNYRFNIGTRFRSHRPLNGYLQARRPADVTDGLSQTVAISERLVSYFPPVQQPDLLESEPRRSFWWTEVRYAQDGEEPLAIDQCRNHRTTTIPQYYGVNSINLNGGRMYDHMLTPNHPACYNGPEDFEVEEELDLIPASSNHFGGVNSLLADGSVHFVNELIDPAVWQALGTRNGQESVAVPF